MEPCADPSTIYVPGHAHVIPYPDGYHIVCFDYYMYSIKFNVPSAMSIPSDGLRLRTRCDRYTLVFRAELVAPLFGLLRLKSPHGSLASHKGYLHWLDCYSGNWVTSYHPIMSHRDWFQVLRGHYVVEYKSGPQNICADVIVSKDDLCLTVRTRLDGATHTHVDEYYIGAYEYHQQKYHSIPWAFTLDELRQGWPRRLACEAPKRA